jgi:cadmium resistance transport/sequestration family protein
MNELISAAIAATIAFIATNIDDILVLMIFFSQVSSSFHPRQIVIGQYLGFSLLVAASLPGYFGGFLVPKAWIGLMGFVPIVLGIKSFFDRETEVQTVSINSGEKSNSLLPVQTYQVAAVTVANGGDNIGIYVPLFASADLVRLIVTLTVFLVLIGVWCWVAYQLGRHSLVVHALTHYGHILVPFVLIGLGIYILWESGTVQLFLPQLSSMPSGI